MYNHRIYKLKIEKITWGIYMYYLLFLLSVVIGLFLTGCTYSITMVHTAGIASDVVDETQSNQPSTTVSPNLTIPAKVI